MKKQEYQRLLTEVEKNKATEEATTNRKVFTKMEQRKKTINVEVQKSKELYNAWQSIFRKKDYIIKQFMEKHQEITKENNLSLEKNQHLKNELNELFKNDNCTDEENHQAYKNYEDNYKNYNQELNIIKDIQKKLNYNYFKLIFKNFVDEKGYLIINDILEFKKYDEKNGSFIASLENIKFYYSEYQEAIVIYNHSNDDNYLYNSYNNDASILKIYDIKTIKKYDKLLNDIRKLTGKISDLKKDIDKIVYNNYIYDLVEENKSHI